MSDHPSVPSTSPRKGAVVVSIALALVACAILYVRYAPGSALSEGASADPVAQDTEPHAHADPAAPAVSLEAASVAPAQPAPPYYRLREHWWTPPASDRLDSRTELRRDPSCANNTFLGSAATVEDLIATHASVRTIDDLERMFYNKDRRFFQRAGRYQSITADWDYQTPARYRVNWFSSSSPTFEGDVRAESLPLGPTDTLDAIEARELIDSIVSGNESGTTTAGGRFLAVSVAESPTTPRIEIGYMNNRPTAVEFEGGECRTLESGEAALCHCNSSRKGEHKHEH